MTLDALSKSSTPFLAPTDSSSEAHRRLVQLRWYLQPLRRFAIPILLLAVAAGVGTYFYEQKLVKPTYQASATVQVNASQSGGSAVGSVIDSQQYAPTAAALIDTQIVASNAIKALQAAHRIGPSSRLTPSGLLKLTTVTVVPNSQLVQVAVTSRSPTLSRAAANALAKAAQTRQNFLQQQKFASTTNTLNSQIHQTQTQINHLKAHPFPGSGKIINNDSRSIEAYRNALLQITTTAAASSTNLTIPSPASTPRSPVAPHPLRSGGIAFALVLVLLSAAVVVREYFTTSLRTPDELAEILGGPPVLGAILKFSHKGRDAGPVVVSDPRSLAAEALRVIRTNLIYANIDRPPRTVLMTSAREGEGKTTIALNLGTAMAELGGEVLLIDADLRRPSLHRFMSLGDRTGLTNALVSYDQSIDASIHPTDYRDLFVMPSGPIPPNPSELLSSERMRELLQRLSGRFSTIIVDSPPLLAVADPAILSTMVDAVVLVADVSGATVQGMVRARESLERVGSRVSGIVLNKLSDDRQGGYYYHYYYRHEYGYGYGPRPDSKGGGNGKQDRVLAAGPSEDKD